MVDIWKGQKRAQNLQMPGVKNEQAGCVPGGASL